MTVPLGPSGGSVRPLSSSVTPPALPSVSTNGRFETHSRLCPAGTVSSLLCPSSVRTRIHVASDARAIRRYGDPTPPVAACTPGSHAGGGAAAREGSGVMTAPAGTGVGDGAVGDVTTAGGFVGGVLVGALGGAGSAAAGAGGEGGAAGGASASGGVAVPTRCP